MAGDLRAARREAHRREEPALLPLANVMLGFLVGRGRRGSDRIEAELRAEPGQLGGCHDRIVPVKAIRIHEDGGPEVLRYEDVPDPKAGPGEVLISLRAASLNHLDLWVRKGLPSVPKPRILGADEWVLVWGIGGGVATAALAIAKALGARVLVTSSSDEKLTRAAELGADAVVNHATGEVAAAAKEVTGGAGIDVVVEHVGGATSGPNPPAQLHRVWWKQLTIVGSTMGTRSDFEAAYALVRSGRAKPVIDRVYPLEAIREAHERLEAGEQLGKIVLAIS